MKRIVVIAVLAIAASPLSFSATRNEIQEKIRNTYVQPAAEQASEKNASEQPGEQEVLALDQQMEALLRSNSA